MSTTTATTYNTISVKEADVHYVEAGSKSSPTLLLLHGFPSSSNQFRNLIPMLSGKYHLLAPDLPSYGNTKITAKDYKHTFENFFNVINQFVEKVIGDKKKFSIYVFDYGAPTGYRLALARPSQIAGIISQNGNAYDEGLGADFWAPLQEYWKTGDTSYREKARSVLSLEATKWQYYNGCPDAKLVDPVAYQTDMTNMDTPEKQEVQLDLFYDYRTNLPLYPKFQEYFRKSKVPLLAVWGKNDEIFVSAGAEAYKRDLPHAQIHLLDGGHFLLESHRNEVASLIDKFLGEIN